MNRSFLIALLLLVTHTTTAQHLNYPKKIKARGDYTHKATGTIFPASIDKYKRKELSTFDRQKNDVDARYEYANFAGKTRVTVYVYPAGPATDARFREEFLNCVFAVSYAAGKQIQDKYTYIPYKKDGYNIAGFSATFEQQGSEKTYLELYECGNWFLKIRVTSSILDSIGITRLSRQFVDTFNPVHLVQSAPLSLQTSVSVSKEAFNDELFLACTIASGLTQVKWVENNVDSMERISGFPGLHLGMYEAGIKGFLSFADTNTTMKVYPDTKKYIDQFHALLDSEFLDEFLLEEYNEVMIVPGNKVFNFASYHQWKMTHPIKIDIHHRYYELACKQKD